MDHDDHALVEAMRRGDPAGLETAYRRYADRLYTYAKVLLGDADSAADAVHDTFLAAGSHLEQLRDPGQLRGWLYGIVRNACRRQLKLRARRVSLDRIEEPVAELPDPGHALGAGQVRDLVHAAAAALNPSDREVFDLALRHDLSAPDVGAAMGLPPNHAHARISRVRTQLERALGALIVARGGAADCPPLAELVDGWDGRLTPLLRKRISRHIDACTVCTRRRRDQVSSAALLAAYVPPASLVIGAEVWPRLTLASSSAGSPVTADATAARPDDRKPSTTPRNRRAVGVAASLLLLAGLGLAASLPEGADRSRPPATAGRGAAGSGAGEPDATKADAAEPGTAGASGSSADGTSASDGPVAPPPDAPVGPPGTTFAPPGAAPTAVSTPPAGPADPQPPAGGAAGNLTAPVTVTATATTRCDGDSYTITVSATASTDIATARLELSGASGPGSRPMTTRGGSARAVVGSQTTRSLAWAVSATAVDGRTARYTGAPVTNPCVQPIPG